MTSIESNKQGVEYLLSLAKLTVNVGSNVGHGSQVLIVLLKADGGILKLDIQQLLVQV